MKRFIECEDRTQITLLPESLDDYVAEGNPVRVEQIQQHLDLHEGGAIPLQDKHIEEQVGLPSVNLISKPLALRKTHSLDAQHRVDEIAT